MRRFKNRIWTKDEYLMFYETLNNPEGTTIYYKDTVLFIKCDDKIVKTREEWDILKADGDDIHKWTIENIPINNFNFIETKQGVIMCHTSEAKQYLKKGVSDCKQGHRINI